MDANIVRVAVIFIVIVGVNGLLVKLKSEQRIPVQISDCLLIQAFYFKFLMAAVDF